MERRINSVNFQVERFSQPAFVASNEVITPMTNREARTFSLLLFSSPFSTHTLISTLSSVTSSITSLASSRRIAQMLGIISLLCVFTVVEAASRGVSVNLRASEKKDAPISDNVELYANSHALVIGIDDYNNGWPKLSNAVADAKAIASELESKGFDVELHIDLGSAELDTVFKRFFILKGADPTARLFIWFAGHGATVDGEGYLIPKDAPTPQKGAEFKFASIALRDFGTFMRQAVSKHVYAVFDSCFAGTVFTAQRALPPQAITRATTLPVRQFLTSGDSDQTVSDDGAFRELFLRAINGDERADANGDGYVTASELGMFLGDRVTNLTQASHCLLYTSPSPRDS